MNTQPVIRSKDFAPATDPIVRQRDTLRSVREFLKEVLYGDGAASTDPQVLYVDVCRSLGDQRPLEQIVKFS